MKTLKLSEKILWKEFLKEKVMNLYLQKISMFLPLFNKQLLENAFIINPFSHSTYFQAFLTFD